MSGLENQIRCKGGFLRDEGREMKWATTHGQILELAADKSICGPDTLMVAKSAKLASLF